MANDKERYHALRESIYYSADILSERARGQFFCALHDYYFRGKEPENLPKMARVLFEGTRHRISRARSVALAKQSTKGPRPVADYEDRYDQYEDYYDQYGYSDDSDGVADYGFNYVPAETRPAHTDVHTDLHTDVHLDLHADQHTDVLNDVPNDPPAYEGVTAPPHMGGTYQVSTASTLEEIFGSMTAQAAPARAKDAPTTPTAAERRTSQGLERKTFGERLAAVSDFATDRDLRMLTDNESTIPQLVQKWSNAGWRDDNGDSMDDEIRYEGELVPRWQACAMGRNIRMAEKAGYSYDQ